MALLKLFTSTIFVDKESNIMIELKRFIMKTKQVAILFLQVIAYIQLASGQQPSWMPTTDFPTPGALNVYCLGLNFGWCDKITVGGYSNTGNYPMFHSNDRGNTWENIGPTPIGTVYSLAQEASTLGTKYAGIRDDFNSANNGLFRRTNTYGWELRACAGLDIRAVVQNNGTVLGGVTGSGRGIYRSTNMGDSFSHIYANADIYCFWAQPNTFWAGGSYPSGSGVILKSTGFPFDTWNEIGTVDGYVIGITVADNGNVFAATHQGKIFRSINGNSFEICRTGINWNILKIPIVATGNGNVYYGDYQNGIYYSSDNGNTWIEYNEGLTIPAHIIDLLIDPCDKNFLYMALGGSLSNHIYYREDFLISTSSNPPEGGSTTGGGSYTYNQTATVSAYLSTGWIFDNWTENGSVVSTSSNYSFNVLTNRNLVANFTPDSYQIQTFENPFNAGFTTGGGNYLYGHVATVEAIPYPNWEFTTWTENGDVVWNYPTYSFTVTDNRNLTANFQQVIPSVQERNEIHSITISPNPCQKSTKISLWLNNKSYLKIDLFDITGSLISSIADQSIEQGKFEKEIDTSLLTVGIYFFKITSQNTIVIKKIIVI